MQSLQEETKSRGRRLVEIIDLGLQPWEAIEMGLPVENVSYERHQPVANYISERTDRDWEEWLQHHRVELNVMSPAELIAWLDRKVEQHGELKVVPPTDVAAQELREALEAEIERQERDRILRESETLIAKRTAVRLDVVTMPDPDELRANVEEAVTTNRRVQWTQYIEDLAAELANGEEGDDA